MFSGSLLVAFPKKGLLVQRQRKLAGKVTLCAPVVGFSFGEFVLTVPHITVGRLMRDVLNALDDAIQAAHLLGVVRDHDVNHDLSPGLGHCDALAAASWMGWVHPKHLFEFFNGFNVETHRSSVAGKLEGSNPSDDECHAEVTHQRGWVPKKENAH